MFHHSNCAEILEGVDFALVSSFFLDIEGTSREFSFKDIKYNNRILGNFF